MVLLEYEVLHPGLNNAGGRELREMARREKRRAARLVSAVERFLVDGFEAGHRVAPELKSGRVEVYAVPPPADLRKLPDAMVLVRVNHTAKTIEMLKIVREFPSPEGDLWEQITEFARQAIG
jgi:hypothetical protein